MKIIFIRGGLFLCNLIIIIVFFQLWRKIFDFLIHAKPNCWIELVSGWSIVENSESIEEYSGMEDIIMESE